MTIDNDEDAVQMDGYKPRAPARPWTSEEDSLLRTAVAEYGDDTDSWKLIAEKVPGRTNKSCRKRWKHSLSPTLKKTAWTKEEDELLVKLHAQFPCKWSMIAKQISGRTDDACAKRYREALDPAIKQGDWTPDEDQKLLQEYRRWGGRWASVAAQLGRSGLGCRNRWRLLERKKAQQSNVSSGPDSSDDDVEPIEVSSPNLPRVPTGDVMLHSEPLAQTSSWAGELLTQFQFDPTRFETTLFGDPAAQFDFNMLLDPSLVEVDGTSGSGSFQFDARLWDIMQGGCGCGCGSGAGCKCNDEVSAPFEDMSSQDFLGPFQQMSHAFAQQGDPPMAPPPQMGDPPIMQHGEILLAQTPIMPSVSSVPMSSTMIPQITSLESSAPPPHYMPHPLAFVDVKSSPSSHVPELPSTTRPSHHAIPAAIGPPRPMSNIETEHIEAIRRMSTSERAPPSMSPRVRTSSADIAAQLAALDPAKWAAALALARVKDQQVSCRCSGTCCSSKNVSSPALSSNATASGSCCSSNSVKRPRSPVSSDRALADPSQTKKVKRSTSVSSSALPRLSSQLPATADADMLPYACGDPICWVSERDIRARFNTSGELLEHHRKVHNDRTSAPEGRAFRCALEGCGKAWKSINGIQYHLQLSKAHFSVALNKQSLIPSASRDKPMAGSCCGPKEESSTSRSTSASPSSDEQSSQVRPGSRRKPHPCPHPGCPNVYKQAAGLKYHLAHGHPDNPPLQLDALPPGLAKKMSEKVRGTFVQAI